MFKEKMKNIWCAIVVPVTTPEPVSQPYLIKTLLVDFGDFPKSFCLRSPFQLALNEGNKKWGAGIGRWGGAAALPLQTGPGLRFV